MRRALRKALGGVSQHRLQFTIPSTPRPRRLAPWILRMCVFYIINKPDYPHSLQFTQSNSNGNLDFTSLRIGQIRRLNCKFVRSWIVFWTALSVPTHCCTQELGNFLNNCLWALSWWHRHKSKQGTLSPSEESLRGVSPKAQNASQSFDQAKVFWWSNVCWSTKLCSWDPKYFDGPTSHDAAWVENENNLCIIYK
jgi:hypothetical protein